MDRKEGMALFWNKDIEVREVVTTALTIEALVFDPELQIDWWFIGVYMSCDANIRKQQWKVLTARRQLWGDKWLLAGDFNDILTNEEKWGGFTGNPWTWSNNWDGEGEIRQRLDRGLSTINWSQFFDKAKCDHVETVGSDHSMLLIDNWPRMDKKRSKFSFDKRWLKREGISQVVEQAWKQTVEGNRMYRITRQIANCRVALLKWKNNFTGNSLLKINQVKQQIKEIKESKESGVKDKISELKIQLKEAYTEEEQFWAQKARIDWLREGDKNTKFFHACVKGRRRRNRMLNIQRDDGSWTKSEEELGKEVAEYYRVLFASSGCEGLGEILNGIPTTITTEMNARLTQEVEEKEIKSALFSMNPNKAPGQDGMNPLFFQKFWHVVKSDLIAAIRHFFWSSNMPKSWNHTVISLIPKIQNPTNLKSYRPISLCNVVYKVISKILANRLKNVLNHCISKTQAAFIPGRQILDNVILSHEYLHYMNNKRQGQNGLMAVKLDMSKAYDRVEWKFLDAMMEKMGYCTVWRKWIWSCLSSVTYSFNINGVPQEFVTPERGIRQGDPLSPYLFLLCSEGFSNLLKQAEGDKRITGVKICRSGPRLTHLFFADDSLIFCNADKEEASELVQILRKYEKGSGQSINLEKSSVFFSRNVSHQRKGEVRQSLGTIQVATQGKYLGLPMVITRSKQQVFGFIKDSISKRMKNWKNKLLSQGGKEVLLKAVSMALPVYTMSCFKLPNTLCKEVTSIFAKYWWGEAEGRDKIHWCSWGRMAMEKKEGGLGFKDLQKFNKALLAKQVWRLITKPNLLVSKVLRAKYFHRDSIFKCKVPKCSSWIWQSLMNVRDLVQKGTRKRIGNGKTTNIWEDIWIPGNEDGKVTSAMPQNCNIRRVDELISGFRWNKPLVLRTFNQKDAVEILDIPISISGREDSNYWVHSGHGSYTVNSGYKVLCRERTQSRGRRENEAETSSANSKGKQWKWLWKLKLKSNRAQEVWKMAPVQWDGLSDQTGNFTTWWTAMLDAICRTEGREHIELTVNILWQIWKRRNEWKFNAKRKHPWKTVKKAQQEWHEQATVWSKENTTPEIAARDKEEAEPEEGGRDEMQIRISTQVQEPTNRIGTGIIATNFNHQLVAAWALIDRKARNQVQNIAEAVKMAIIKAKQQQWQKITVYIPSPQLLKGLTEGIAKDIKMATLTDDINNLRALFQKCSFCLDRRLDSRCDLISGYALGIFQDEEWINSQYV
ncbi:uncharacterized protein [Coffea arabica]|uniref:Reverse transcriptase domain-containing protein n=1 Tax=Coffea arabica TaxID=13443 RepID=A0ABM4VQN8_COFAR